MEINIIEDFIDKHLYADAASTLEAANTESVPHFDALKLQSCANFDGDFLHLSMCNTIQRIAVHLNH